jgi:hypothetical protein
LFRLPWGNLNKPPTRDKLLGKIGDIKAEWMGLVKKDKPLK